MQRRKLLIGLGSLAAGGAAALGTGAFSSVSAERSIAIDTAADANAFLAVEPEDDAPDAANADEYVSVNDNGLIELDFTQTAAGGQGLNRQATTIIRDLLEIQNQGTEEVVVWFSNIPEGMSFFTDDPNASSFDGSSTGPDGCCTLAGNTNISNLPSIATGEVLDRVGVIFRDPEAAAADDGTVTVNAATVDELQDFPDRYEPSA